MLVKQTETMQTINKHANKQSHKWNEQQSVILSLS